MSRSRRLCMVVHGSYPLGEVRVAREALAAIEAGWEVDVIAMRKPGEKAVESVDGVTVIRLPLSRNRGAGVAAMAYEYLGYTLLASVKLAVRMPRRRYRVVQVHNPPDFLMLAALVPRLLGARVIFDVHDFAPWLFESRFAGRRGADRAERVLYMIERLAARFSTAVVTVHDPYRRALEERGVSAEKITVVLNGLDERLAARPGRLAMPARGFASSTTGLSRHSTASTS